MALFTAEFSTAPQILNKRSIIVKLLSGSTLSLSLKCKIKTSHTNTGMSHSGVVIHMANTASIKLKLKESEN
jgi:hypothetical protein